MSEKSEKYDFIIAGGGMSGLSLAYKLCISNVKFDKLLIIDKDKKTQNDRTWAFWEKESSVFDDVVSQKWNSIKIADNKGIVKQYPLKKYTYKLIRGIDFYKKTLSYLENHPKVTFAYSEIESISETKNSCIIKTNIGEEYSAPLVFDSISKLDLTQKNRLHFLQHFYGEVIKFDEDIFDTAAPEMMNYDVEQKEGESRFMYLIPFSKREALLEFTIFSENLLEKEEYKSLLDEYLEKRFKEKKYTIEEEEYGVIPMSNADIEINRNSKIIKIGTAGGSTHPATGYTFAGTQKHLDEIVRSLENDFNLSKLRPALSQKYTIYASTLLQVMKNKDLAMDEVFSEMFVKNNVDDVFDFLGAESTFLQELKIMWNTPIVYFGKAFFQTLFSRIK
jgi:lycopene beta-cyclase